MIQLNIFASIIILISFFEIFRTTQRSADEECRDRIQGLINLQYWHTDWFAGKNDQITNTYTSYRFTFEIFWFSELTGRSYRDLHTYILYIYIVKDVATDHFELSRHPWLYDLILLTEYSYVESALWILLWTSVKSFIHIVDWMGV